MIRTNDKEGLKSEVGVPPDLQGRGRLARVLEKEKKHSMISLAKDILMERSIFPQSLVLATKINQDRISL